MSPSARDVGERVSVEIRDAVRPPARRGPTEDEDDERVSAHGAHDKFGPMIMARQFTEASGRWPELRAELVTLYDHDEPMEYLRILGGKCL